MGGLNMEKKSRTPTHAPPRGGRSTNDTLPPPPLSVAAFGGAALCFNGQPVLLGGRRKHEMPTLSPRWSAETEARLNDMPREAGANVVMNPIRKNR